jgi:SAM-dependent methyltransferase
MAGPPSDHYGRIARVYAAFRPRYPDALFQWLAGLAPGRATAWDCGAGSGQASRGLGEHFERVIATDGSAGQLREAPKHPRIEWRVAPAERSGLSSSSVVLVTVAQALHWFDVPAFYAEVERVLVPGGVLAVWSYQLLSLGDAMIDRAIAEFYSGTLGPYWPPERRLVDEGYRSLPFPWQEIAPPPLTMEARWDLAHLVGYLRSWSATARYLAAHGSDPVERVERRLAAAWGDPAELRTARWPLTCRAGRRPA